MKLFFLFLCNALFCISTVFAVDFSTQMSSQQTQMENNAPPENKITPKLSTDLESKSKRVITVRMYTEEDCD